MAELIGLQKSLRSAKRRKLITREKGVIMFAFPLIVVLLTFSLFLAPAIQATVITTNTTTSDADFNLGTLTDAVVQGSGSGAFVELEGTQAADWFNTGWQYRRPITVNSTNTSVLDEYQMRITLTTSNFDYTNVKSDCSDIRFGDTSGNELPYYQISCNTSGTSIFDVQVSQITASSNTTIYVYYGNVAASSNSSIERLYTYSSPREVGYIVHNDLAGDTLDIISLANGNEITNGTSTLNLDLQDTGTFPSSQNSENTAISATKLFHADGNNGGSDMLVPVSWAGTEFIYASNRASQTFCMLSPWGTAAVSIYDNGSLSSTQTVNASGTCVADDIGNGNTYRIVSDIPILIVHDGGGTDSRVNLPASANEYWYGIPSNFLEIGAGPSGASVSVEISNGTNTVIGIGSNSNYSQSGFGSYGATDAYRLTSSTEIGANQLADSDGNESSTFVTERYLGTRYASANQAGYIAVAAPTANTECTLYNPNGTQNSAQTGGALSTVNYIGFGTGSSSTFISGGWYMECDNPVMAYYEKDSNDSDETNLWTYPMMRQYSYPEPTVDSIQAEESLLEPIGTWESQVFDLVWNGGWGDGTGSSNAFTANVANLSANGQITIEAKAAADQSALSSVSYTSLGTFSSGTSITFTNSDFTTASIATGSSGRFVQFNVILESFDSVTNPQLQDLSFTYLADNTDPDTNASSIQMERVFGGDSIADGTWTNNLAPYFSWLAGADTESGIGGYCLYLGQDISGDPEISKGLLGTSLTSIVGNPCPFIIDSEGIDFSNTSYQGSTWLTTSNDLYYLNIKAIDLQGNIFGGNSTQFSFYFDDTEPTNPAYINLPAGFVSEKDITITWPTTGSNATNDDHSGVAGLQYRIGDTGTWYGDLHLGSELSDDLLADDGSYTTDPTFDYPNIIEGATTIYFRTWDVAGNITSIYTSGVIKFNSSAPTPPNNLVVTPNNNTINSFAFNWNPPASFTGQESNITYCYTINTLPSVSTCTYTDAGVTSLPANAFANQPGINSFYVVARDESFNINYATYISTTFEYAGTAPGIPLNTVVTDISNRDTSNWRLSVSWDEPTNIGNGISYYEIYRSNTNSTCIADFASFTNVGTSSTTSYTDDGLTQQDYFYCVLACDNANNCSAPSNTSDNFPTGKFTEPAVLTTSPQAINITTTRATIEWNTDRVSNSRVSFGLSSGAYFAQEPSNTDQVANHSIELTNLRPNTTYYYQAKWTDVDGNTGTSTEKTFVTQAQPTISSVNTFNIRTNDAGVQFTAERAQRVILRYGNDLTLNQQIEIDTSLIRSTYSQVISGLDANTTYFYTLNPIDIDGNEYNGTIFSFNTNPLPVISDITIQEVADTDDAQLLVEWTTNIPTSSLIEYFFDEEESLSSADLELKTDHAITLSGLVRDTLYKLTILGEDTFGNIANSDIQEFTTSTDTKAPTILNAQGNAVAEEDSIQLVVSWETDEPATSQLEYGLGAGGPYTEQTVEDTSPKQNHLIIIQGLLPNEIYHYQVVSRDVNGNVATSKDFVIITPEEDKPSLNIIIDILRSIFSF